MTPTFRATCAALLLVVCGIGQAADGESPESRAHALLDADPPDWAGAREAFVEAAEAGSPTAMSHLGWLYEEGLGVTADMGQAVHWYRRAAHAGAHVFAMKLGWMYLGGQGVERDRAEAARWFALAIEADHAPARVGWASVLISDAIGGRNPDGVFEARDLLEHALDDGYMLAALYLARLHVEGIGSHPVDLERGARYTAAGAEAGIARLQGWLAYMYLHGDGVTTDHVLAAKWANIAAANGDDFGNDLRLALDEQLTAEQVDEARRRAVDWALAQATDG